MSEINMVNKNKQENSDNVFFKVPTEIGLARNGIPQGYELIAKSQVILVREARKLSIAKWKLAEACKRYGANVVLDFKEESFLRNSIGFSFYMHRVSGVAGVIAQRDEDGTETLAELENLLDEKAIAEDAQRTKSGEIGKKIIRYFCIMMFIVFCIGFLISK